jgi:hypothetical protein
MSLQGYDEDGEEEEEEEDDDVELLTAEEATEPQPSEGNLIGNLID